MRNPNKILGAREKDCRGFHQMNLALEKMRIFARKIWIILGKFRR